MRWRWLVEVEDAFSITGRGTGVVGRVRGNLTAGPAVLCVGGSSETIERVTVEMLDRLRDGRRVGLPALLLHGVEKDRVPAGAVVRSVD